MSDVRWFRQPDRRSCGAATMVTARMLHEAAYAVQVRDQAAFSTEALLLHRRLTSLRGPGGLQLPWPRALGTPPWAVAGYLGALTGRRYRVRWVARRGVRELVAARKSVLAGAPVAIYVGSRWLPRHVVLGVAAPDDGLLLYEPSAGALRTIAPGPWRWHRLGLAGWRRPWFVVLPDDARSR
ncbi:hypothetical protein NODU109028_19370 [Nocardioides dubius]|uniref:Peptidase C39-like domain-containing protein n=1 Tax=Nocardioides dubius TaxID=317019 RepID=A0ABN1TKZ7_9ACTN